MHRTLNLGSLVARCVSCVVGHGIIAKLGVVHIVDHNELVGNFGVNCISDFSTCIGVVALHLDGDVGFALQGNDGNRSVHHGHLTGDFSGYITSTIRHIVDD